MSLGEGSIGKLLVAFYATDRKSFNFIDEAVGYSSSPTFDFKGGGSWLAYLCREATLEEQVDYWRQRASEAEGKVERPDVTVHLGREKLDQIARILDYPDIACDRRILLVAKSRTTEEV